MDVHRGEVESVELPEPTATDGELLRRFAATRDESAFGELVRRYASMVLAACRRTLGDHHDAEEAFQATFMVLAAKAARVKVGGSLGPWLYGVAYRVARRAAATRARRRETPLVDDQAMIDDALENVAQCHLRRVLDEELAALPEKYRGPLILHYLWGRTNREAAEELGLSVRTVEGRQRRGKALLKRRLRLRQVSLPMALTALAAMPPSAAAAARLAERAIEAGLCYVNGNSGACSAEAVRLAQSEALAMTSTMAPASATFVSLLVIGAAVAVAGGDKPVGGGRALPLDEAAAELAAAEADVLEAPAVFVSVEDEEDSNPSAAPESTRSKNQEESKGSAGKVRSSDSFDFYKISESEQKIRQALDSPLRMPLDFIETPLNQVMQIIEEEYDIPIMFDTGALDVIAVSPETEVTIQIREEIPLSSALQLMFLGIDDLTYTIKYDVLLITTKEAANASMEWRIYDMSFAPFELEELVNVIGSTIEHDSWMKNTTGEGEIMTLGGSWLVVSQTPRVHREILKFLEQIKRNVDQATPAPKGFGGRGERDDDKGGGLF